MLADAKDVEADLVGQHGLLDDVAEDLGLRVKGTVGRARDVAEGVDAEFECRH